MNHMTKSSGFSTGERVAEIDRMIEDLLGKVVQGDNSPDIVSEIERLSAERSSLLNTSLPESIRELVYYEQRLRA